MADLRQFVHEVILDYVEENSQQIGGQWVFGGVERGTRKMFLVAVHNRTKETLMGLIQEWIKPGTTIYSDCWKSYATLGQHILAYNHSQHSGYSAIFTDGSKQAVYIGWGVMIEDMHVYWLHTSCSVFTAEAVAKHSLQKKVAVVKVTESRLQHVMNSNLVPLKTCCVGERFTLNLSSAQTSVRCSDAVLKRGDMQASFSSLAHGSKLRGLSPKALKRAHTLGDKPKKAKQERDNAKRNRQWRQVDKVDL
ncbi:DDE_Tnp_IS1595 domain-containing protein [Trichonephila clavipes]|nr:DDE_Tnp_IS1595 domain-containing protein [Trichonephila clavipes]